MTYCIRLQFPVTAKNCPKLRGVFLFHYLHPPSPLCTDMQLATGKVVNYRGQHASTNQQRASI